MLLALFLIVLALIAVAVVVSFVVVFGAGSYRKRKGLPPAPPGQL